ncbi:MAG: NfeD family protein [Intrasporangium sp.]|uniref:NfeD family protein n=1 Tax=Intrasporangium sp. TaxID=1925024 RepID=UPI0026477608|nr:NfeD family protein [Intrasporangium sp.]MDN5795645.1 NfeD family protein [Intrasporangium sp.]
MVLLGAVVVLAGLAVVVIEAHVMTGGVLAVAGAMAVAAGAGLMMAGLGAALVVTVPVAIAIAGLGVLGTIVAARKVTVARRQALRTGPTALVGTVATVQAWDLQEGQVAADGTLWRAVLSGDWQDTRPVPGETVIIETLDGLTLSVRPLYAQGK